MDIYTLIHNDHEAAKKLLADISVLPSAHANNRRALFKQLKEAVIAHNDAEADSFYIALEEFPETKGMALHSEEEHVEAAKLFAELSNNSLNIAQWDEKFNALQKALLAHIEKEEGDVFTAARKVISAEMANELAVAMEQLKQRKQELLHKAS